MTLLIPSVFVTSLLVRLPCNLPSVASSATSALFVTIAPPLPKLVQGFVGEKLSILKTASLSGAPKLCAASSTSSKSWTLHHAPTLLTAGFPSSVTYSNTLVLEFILLSAFAKSI